MTLIQFVGFGGRLVAIASDTRQVNVTSFLGITVNLPYEDSEEKSGRISKFVVFGGGGLTRGVDRLRELTVEYANGAETLDDYLPAVEKAVETMRTEKDFIKLMDKPEAFHAVIGGFNLDGTTGTIKFATGKGVRYEEHERDKPSAAYMTPSADEDEIIKSFEFIPPKKMNELPMKVVEHLATVQKACFLNDEEHVSEKCVYSVIYRNPQTREIKRYEGSLIVIEQN